MIAIVLATKMEARPLIKALGAKKISRKPFAIYEFPAAGGRPGGIILVTGMGRSAAAAAMEHLFAAHPQAVKIPLEGATDAVVNVGICGALGPGLAPGDLLAISRAVDGDAVLRGETAQDLPCSAGGWGDLRAGSLATVTDPVFQGDRKARLAGRADVADMEGWTVAEACSRRGVECHLLKGVSDLADGRGKLTILRNIHWVSRKLTKAVVDELGQVFAEDRGAKQQDSPVLLTLNALRSMPHGFSLARRVLGFVKIEHNLFSLPLLLAGAYLGAGMRWPSLKTLGLIVAAGVGARALGMSMNRIFDRRLDAFNPRTAGRELPSGRLSLGAGLAVAAGGLALYLLACWLLGPVCLMLSPLPAVPLIGYSLLKRFTSLCHFGIGLCLGMAPLAAFVAASGSTAFTAPVLLLAVFTFCWISGFDIIYALQDLPADRRTGVHSIPVAIGPGRSQIVSAGVHAVAIASAVWLWRMMGGFWVSGAALALAVAAFVAGYLPQIPLARRFFPISAIASFAGSMIPLTGGLP